jgi:hypothetical protein
MMRAMVRSAGVLVVALAALTLGGCCLFGPPAPRRERAVAAAAVVDAGAAAPRPARAPGGDPAAADPAADDAAAVATGAAVEAVTATPTSVRASVAAAPRWVSRHSSRFTRDSALAPQLDGVDDLYHRHRGRSPAEALGGALLVCRATVTIKTDTFGAADLKVKLRLGKHPTVTLWGPEDNDVYTFSVPLVALRRGETIEVTLWDRDVTTDEHIGTGRQKYDGILPLVFEERDWNFQCRVVPAAEVGTLLAARLTRLDAALAQLARYRPDWRAADWGRPALAPGPVRHELQRAAAVVGWAEPKVAARARRGDEIEARWASQVRAEVEAAVAALPPPTQAVDLPAARLRGRVTAGSCGATRGCQLTLEVQSTAAQERSLEPGHGLGEYRDLQLVMADGSLHEAHVDLVDDGTAPVRLAPGATARLRVATRFSGHAGPARLVELLAGRPQRKVSLRVK